MRAGGWGTAAAAYRDSGEQVAVVPHMESRAAVEAVREIGTVDGLGALFVDPADLAVVTELSGGSAELAVLLDGVEAAAKELGVSIGTATGADPVVARELAQRYDFVMLSNDATMLGQAAADLLGVVRGG